MKKFSVLMSVYHKECPENLKSSLDSVFSQTVRADEVVLVEDGALTDELEAVVRDYEKRYQGLKVVRFAENRGLGFALNDGLKACSYELVARMDADDICKPQRFEKELKVFEAHPDYGMVGSWIDEFEHVPGDSSSVRKVPETPEENLKYAKSRCPVNHPTVMYRKSDVMRAGCYQTALFPEDYFLWIKMLQNGTKVYNIQESLLWFRFSIDTFKRRGGWKYACDEAKTQWNIYRLGFIGIPTLCKNVAVRFTTRILPNWVRAWMYQHVLRK